MLGESADAHVPALNTPADDNEVIRSLLVKCVLKRIHNDMHVPCSLVQ